MSSDRGSTAAWMTRASTAVFGAALAIGIGPVLQHRATPNELPGALPVEGLSPSGPVLQFAALLLFLLTFAILGNIAARRLAGTGWANVGYCAALLSSPLPLMHFGNVRHVLLHGAVAVGILFARNLNPRFSRDDAVLLPTLLTCYFAFLDIGFGKTPLPTFLRAAIFVFALRIIVGSLSRMRHPAFAFAAAPLAFIFQMGWFSPAPAAIVALIWIMGTTLLLAMMGGERIAARALTFVIYPIALTAYPLALIDITSRPPVDFFEDGHDFLVASEMLRGEKPYKDVLPTHGFLADGGFDFVFMKSGADTIGEVLRARRVIEAMNLAAVYFIVLAASGSGAAGCLAVFLTVALFPTSTFFVRTIPALLSLACFAAATRLRSSRWLAIGGAALAVALLTSVDFAAYTAIVALVAIVRWPQRFQAARAVALGFFAILIPAFVLFAIGGFARAFVSGTIEIVRSGRVFVSGPFAIPECLRSLSAMVWQLPNLRCLSAILWVIAVVLSVAGIARAPLRAKRDDAIWYVGLWIAIAGLAWVERQHAYYDFVLPAFAVASLLRFRRHRVPVIAIAVALIFLARPFAHVFDVATMFRGAHGLHPEGWVEVRVPPRARDALLLPRSAAALASMQRYVSSQMRPNDTFFDFSYSALLYYLFDRNCPIPQVGVPFYESEEAQQKVIAALQRNGTVRAAVIEFPGGMPQIDGVTNWQRAPLVWRYLQENFAPALNENGVVIWRRR